jgi:hypothetical protein
MRLRSALRIFALTSAVLAATDAGVAEESIPADPPARPQRTSRLLTIGRAFTVQAAGCDSRTQRFRVTAIQPIDRSKVDEKQVLSGVFFVSQERTGRAGWQNVAFSPDGRSVEFELYAEGAGTRDDSAPGRHRCESPSVARAVVDIQAWVFD